ncbi:hypothetical protein [Methylobacterium sp. A54F]
MAMTVAGLAPGYALALLLEVAGAVTFGLGCLLLRAERRARAGELKTFLQSGNAVAAPPRVQPHPARAARPARAPRAVRPVPPPVARPAGPSEAGLALRRAFGRGEA